jgi:hypothetical protein
MTENQNQTNAQALNQEQIALIRSQTFQYMDIALENKAIRDDRKFDTETHYLNLINDCKALIRLNKNKSKRMTTQYINKKIDEEEFNKKIKFLKNGIEATKELIKEYKQDILKELQDINDYNILISELKKIMFNTDNYDINDIYLIKLVKNKYDACIIHKSFLNKEDNIYKVSINTLRRIDDVSYYYCYGEE